MISPHSQENRTRKFRLCSSFFFLSYSSSTFFTIKHNSKSIRRLRTVHTSNECSTITSSSFWVRAACKLRSTSYGQNARRGGFPWPVRQFVRNFAHNSKTKGGIRTFYLSNYCSTIRNIYSLS